ncbi:MAG TPA: crosslink repair DNA glycosylase YcaQ family protein [Actinomycetes bacterium]|nr:crosslink repair DNA glycosylase YcaQ family protein [Actinomycetes bacterium]
MGDRRLERLTLAQARRVALAAQGFGQPRPLGTATRRDLRRVLKHTGLLQIDSVNVLARAHYMPLFSRLGPYPSRLLEDAAYKDTARQPRELFEYWGHEASLIPMSAQPLFRWRMAEVMDHAWDGMKRLATEQPDLLKTILQDVRAHGPISAGELAKTHQGERPRKKGPWWDWDTVKTVLEFLFWSGEVTTASRRGFERLYDIPERVIPARILNAPTPTRDDAQRQLMLMAADSLGVAAARDLRDYYRLSAADAKQRLAELVDAGELVPIDVEGWRLPAYVKPGLAIPRKVRDAALVSPFDPLVWERDRAERLFGFRYRIEIYVPAHKRVHGYYVLPFMLDEHLAARVDLKADRQAGLLRVQAAFLEDHAPDGVPERLADELTTLAQWLELGDVVVHPKGDLAPALASLLTAGQ